MRAKLIIAMLLLIIALAGIFFSKGLNTPSVENQAEVLVNAPISKCFAIFNDMSTLGEWLPNFKSMELTSGEHQKVGSTYKMTMDDGGRKIVMQETITAFVENQQVAFDLEDSFVKFQINVQFVAIDSLQTRITQKSIGSGKGLMAKSMIAWMRGIMQKQTQKQFDDLKKLVEKINI